MFQKFFTDTIQSKFIKELLRSTPLPTYKTVDDDDYIIAGCYYIYKSWIIRCNRTGYLNLMDTSYITVSEDLPISEDLYLLTGYKTKANFDIVGDYIFGQKYKFTENYISKYNFYDSDTHYWLGKYLRTYRDIYGIDLMPFYNCFNYKVISNFHMERTINYDENNNYSSTDIKLLNESDSRYKVLAVPIQFNKWYTIAIDSISPILYKAVLYGNLGLIYGTSESGEIINLSTEIQDTIIYKENTSFKNPFKIRIHNADKKLQQFEKYLYLFLQVPVDNQSALVVLEGDYTQNKGQKIFDFSCVNELTRIELNKLMISNLSLLQMNSKVNYAFPLVLVEYLLNSVITDYDDLWKNIYRTQLLANYINTPGVWDDGLRYVLFNKYMNTPNVDKIDVNGYVDSKLERYLLRKGGK